MKHLATEISINAPADVVWEVLTDLDSYSEWNPHVVEAAGEVRVGVFDGRHIFELEPTPVGTRLVQREEFTGILVPLFARSLDKGTKAGFEAMNLAIKQRAEARVHERG